MAYYLCGSASFTDAVSKETRVAIVEAYAAKSSGFGPDMLGKSILEMLKPYNVSISTADLQLSAMTALDVDWQKEGSEMPNGVARLKARSVLKLSDLLDISPAYVTASAEGGVGICFKQNGIYADIECFNTGETWAIISDRINPAETWQVEDSKRDIALALLKIGNALRADA